LVGVVDAPSIRLVLCPLPLVLDLAVGKVKNAFAMHHVVLPVALVVAAVVEDVFAFAVLEPLLFLPDVLVAVRILLVDVLDLLVLDLDGADAGGEHPASALGASRGVH
jgi:hypothetical protein